MAGQYGSEERILTSLDSSSLQVLSAIRTTITAKNVTAGTIGKGTPCYITGSGTGGNLVGVIPADASNPSLMPAGVVLAQDLTAGSEGDAVVVGFINGINTAGFNSGDSLYTAVGGGYTNVKPTGSNLIQKIGNVEKVDGNDVPNIPEGYIWVGNSDQVATPTSTGSFAKRNEVNTFTENQNIQGTLAVVGTTNSPLQVSEQTGLSGSVNVLLQNFGGSSQPTIYFSGDNAYFQADGNFNVENAPGGVGSGSMTFTTNGNLGFTTNGTGSENISFYANSGNIDLTTAASSQTNINGSLAINAKDTSPFSIASGSQNISVQLGEFGGQTQPEIIFTGDNSFFSANNNFVVSADNSMDLRSNGANTTVQSNNNTTNIFAGDKVYLSGSNQLNIDTSNFTLTDSTLNAIIQKPGSGQENLIDINGQVGYYSGFPAMSQVNLGLQSLSQQYNGFVFELYDSPSYNWGTDLAISANGVYAEVIGSGSGNIGEINVYANSAGTTYSTMRSTNIDIGNSLITQDIDLGYLGPNTATTKISGNQINIGSSFGFTDTVDIDTNTLITLDSAQVDITGSVNVVNDINVAGAINAQTTLNVTGVTTFNNNLEVTGSVNITDGIVAQGYNEIGGGGQLYVNGHFEASGFSKFTNNLQVTGSLGVSGSMNLVQGKPATGTQANIIDIEGQLGYYTGFPPMTQTNFGLQSYSSQQYNGLVTEMWDSPSYNWGVDHAISANGVFSEVIASGSGAVAELNVYATSAGTTFGSYRAQNIDIGTNSDLATLDLGYIGPSSATTKLAGNQVYVGSNFGYTDEIYIDANNELRLDGASINITGSVAQQPSSISIASATASIDFNSGNIQTLTLASGTATHLEATNMKPGQSVLVEITQDGTSAGTVTIDGSITFPGGTDYSPTTTLGGKDVLTLVSFDGTSARAVGQNDFS
jgi:hypothetical protein